MSDSSVAPKDAYGAAEQLLWTLYQMDGSSTWIDVEDLFLSAFQASPARLSWRTRPDIPDYKKCAKALQELEDPKRSAYAGFTLKQGKYLRKMSDSGTQWCEEHADLLTDRYSQFVESHAVQDDGRLLRQLIDSEAFHRFSSGTLTTAERWLLAEAFRCLPDSSPATWNARFAESLKTARKNRREDVTEFVQAAEAIVSGGN